MGKQENGEMKEAAGTKFHGKPLRDPMAGAMTPSSDKASKKPNEHKK